MFVEALITLTLFRVCSVFNVKYCFLSLIVYCHCVQCFDKVGQVIERCPACKNRVLACACCWWCSYRSFARLIVPTSVRMVWPSVTGSTGNLLSWKLTVTTSVVFCLLSTYCCTRVWLQFRFIINGDEWISDSHVVFSQSYFYSQVKFGSG